MEDIWLKFLGSLTVHQVIPLLILLMQFMMLVFILYRAQRRPDFDIAGFLRDENHKESAGRAYGFVCLFISTWVMMSMTFADKMTQEFFWAFMLVFAGTPVLMELAKRWNGILPFSSNAGPSFPPQQPQPRDPADAP